VLAPALLARWATSAANCCRGLIWFCSVVDWKLDPEKFPRRIDLEVSEEVVHRLEQISLRTGLSISEIASSLVAQGAELSFQADERDQDPMES